MQYNFDLPIERATGDSIKWNAEFLEKKFQVKDVLPLWVADMDFKVAEPIIQAIKERAEHGIFGYNFADKSYFESVISWFQQRYHWKIEERWISITPGIVPAINFLIQTYTRPGDAVVIQEPVYYPFKDSILANGRIPLINELIEKDCHYCMDLQDLEQKFQSPRVKMFILCSPHNPVGRVWIKTELLHLSEICEKYDILVVSDEIHCDLTFLRHSHIPFASLSPENLNRTITCTAASKTFNLAGLQTSNIIIPNPKLRKEFQTTLESLSLLGVNLFGITAVKAAYMHGHQWLEEVLQYIYQNYQKMREFLEEQLPQVIVFPLEGTYLAWLDFRPLKIPAKELDNLIKKHAKVLLDDGAIFGNAGEGFQRVNLACPWKTLHEALMRIAQACREFFNKQPEGS
ncbi:MAG: MalY/PatB family protein [Promethearchaeota archaeon]